MSRKGHMETNEMIKIAGVCSKAANRALNGDLELEELRSSWPLEADKDRLLWKLMSEVEHYIVDQDLRLKDPSYARYQRALVESLIADVEKKYE